MVKVDNANVWSPYRPGVDRTEEQQEEMDATRINLQLDEARRAEQSDAPRWSPTSVPVAPVTNLKLTDIKGGSGASHDIVKPAGISFP